MYLDRLCDDPFHGIHIPRMEKDVIIPITRDAPHIHYILHLQDLLDRLLHSVALMIDRDAEHEGNLFSYS